MANNFNLTDMGTSAATAVTSVLNNIAADISSFGASTDPAQMMQVQVDLTIMSTVTQAWAGIIKETGDTLKATVQKF